MALATLLRESLVLVLFLQTQSLDCAAGPTAGQSTEGASLIQLVEPTRNVESASPAALLDQDGLFAHSNDKMLSISRGNAQLSPSLVIVCALVLFSLFLLGGGCYFALFLKTPFNCNDFCKMVAHFVVTHCHALIAFYLGLHSYITTLSFWQATHIMIKTADELALRKISKTGGALGVKPFGEFLDCIKSDARAMMNSFTPDLKCLPPPQVAARWGVPVRVNILFAATNYAGLLLVIATILVLLGSLLCLHTARGLGQGRYITFTYTVQGSMGYKVMAMVIVIFSGMLFLDGVYFMYQLYTTGDFANVLSFGNDLFVSLVLIVYSAITLWQSARVKLPFFDCTSEKFKDLEFKRGWKDVMQHNTAFTESLGIALLQSKDGLEEDLKAICTSPVAEVQQSVVVRA